MGTIYTNFNKFYEGLTTRRENFFCTHIFKRSLKLLHGFPHQQKIVRTVGLLLFSCFVFDIMHERGNVAQVLNVLSLSNPSGVLGWMMLGHSGQHLICRFCMQWCVKEHIMERHTETWCNVRNYVFRPIIYIQNPHNLRERLKSLDHTSKNLTL